MGSLVGQASWLLFALERGSNSVKPAALVSGTTVAANQPQICALLSSAGPGGLVQAIWGRC